MGCYYKVSSYSPLKDRLQGISAYRMSGDIDVWVTGGLDLALKLAEMYHTDADVIEQHIHLPIFEDSEKTTDVKFHFIPSILRNPIADKNLQNGFHEH